MNNIQEWLLTISFIAMALTTAWHFGLYIPNKYQAEQRKQAGIECVEGISSYTRSLNNWELNQSWRITANSASIDTTQFTEESLNMTTREFFKSHVSNRSCIKDKLKGWGVISG